MKRWLAGLAFGVVLGAAAQADEMSPMVGILAPEGGGVAFHAVRGWQPTEQPLRVLDDAGRPLCCLRVGRALTAPSDLQIGDAGRGARYAVTTEGKLAQRVTKGPILAPVLLSGVKVGRTGREQTHLQTQGGNWMLERCATQEGLRLTISSAGQSGKTVYYFPLGYDVEPTCR